MIYIDTPDDVAPALERRMQIRDEKMRAVASFATPADVQNCKAGNDNHPDQKPEDRINPEGGGIHHADAPDCLKD